MIVPFAVSDRDFTQVYFFSITISSEDFCFILSQFDLLFTIRLWIFCFFLSSWNLFLSSSLRLLFSALRSISCLPSICLKSSSLLVLAEARFTLHSFSLSEASSISLLIFEIIALFFCISLFASSLEENLSLDFKSIILAFSESFFDDKALISLLIEVILFCKSSSFVRDLGSSFSIYSFLAMFFSSAWIFWSSTAILLSSSFILAFVISVALFISISPSNSLIEDTVESFFSSRIPFNFADSLFASIFSSSAFASLALSISSSSFWGTSVGLIAFCGCEVEPHTGQGILSTKVSAKIPAWASR